MTPSLDIELGKIDLKFGKAESLEDRPKLEFFIRYCHPIAVDKPGDGLAVAIRRFKEDKYGMDGLFILSKNYSCSLEGLFDARCAGISAVKMLYDLESIDIEEIKALPNPRIVREDIIYRLKFDQLILE